MSKQVSRVRKPRRVRYIDGLDTRLIGAVKVVNYGVRPPATAKIISAQDLVDELFGAVSK